MQGRIEFRVGGAGRTSPSTVLPNANASPAIVVERRAADVIVLGDSALASAACASLARRGKKVIHLPDMGIDAPQQPVQEALKPLILPDTNLQLASMSNEAARFFQGLEMQVSSQLVHRCRSLDIATVSSPLRERQGAAAALADLMTALAETSRAAGFKVAAVAPSDMPLLRLTENMKGLLQADGGVVNAVAAAGALRTLAQRAGALHRENLLLRGWQDLGSCVRVRASSRLQPDAVSLFEAEQVLLAPGAWAPDCLRLWGLDTELKMRGRPALRCTSSPDLSSLPLVRNWCTPDTPDTQQPTVPSSQGTGQKPPGTPPGGSRTRGAAVTADDSPRVDSQWVLFPRSGAAGTCKLTGLSPGQRLLTSCWQLQPSATGTAGSAGAGSSSNSRSSSGSSSSGRSRTHVLAKECQQAAQLVRGLGRPVGTRAEDATGDEGDEEEQLIPTVSTAWDVVAPDGLPVLGWHPGFEEGRVLVACTAGSSSLAPVEPTDVKPLASSSTQGVQQNTGTSAGQQAQRSSGKAAEAVSQGPRPPAVATFHDGWHLTPLLAKGAADLLLSVPLVDLPLDIKSLAVSRSGLGARGKQEEGGPWAVDTWDGLAQLQTGEMYRRQTLSEEQQQEREEALHARQQGTKV